MGPIEKELAIALQKRLDNGMKQFHVSWSSESDSLSREQKAQEVLNIFKEQSKRDAMSNEEKMLIDMKIAFKAAEQLPNSSFNLKTLKTNPLTDKEIQSIFRCKEEILMFLGNWVRK